MAYGKNALEERRVLWSVLKTLHSGITDRWVLSGDFNAVVDVENRIHGQPITENEIRDFREFLGSCNIFEMNSTGKKYTWSNGHVFSKIDWAICNT